MNRRDFIRYQSYLLSLAFFSKSSFAWAKNFERPMNWDQFIEVPTAVPTDGSRQIPDPPQQNWPLQKTPNFNLVQKHIAGVRPYRHGGFRSDTERWNSPRKTIIHNYGHGGAGITLSWGVCELALERLLRESPPLNEPVAVLGAGVIGLTTAYLLLEKGFRVRIYSEKFHPQVTSSVAGGQFAPSIVEIPSGISLSNLLLRSWKRFAPLDEKGVGVSYAPNFMTSSGSGYDSFPPGTIPGGQSYRLRKLPFEGPAKSGSYAWTLLIEPPIYLPWLTSEIENRGGQFRQIKIQNRNDVAALSESFVVNCLGLGAKTVFQDSRVEGMRGQLVLLEPQSLGYLLSFNGGYLFSRRDAVVLGGTYESGVDNIGTTPAAYQRILRRNKAFFGLEH